MKCLAFAMLVLLAASILVVSAQSECKDNLGAIITECLKFVKIEGPNNPPSKACCEAINDADIPCLCKHITGHYKRFISMEKAYYVAKTCGVQSPPPGTKCGSYIIPTPTLPAPKA